MSDSDGFYEIDEVAPLKAEIARLEADNARLRAALTDMIEISQRNSEAALMLLAIRKCAQHALDHGLPTADDVRGILKQTAAEG